MLTLSSIPNLDLLPQSLTVTDTAEWALAGVAGGLRLVILVPQSNASFLSDFEGEVEDRTGEKLLVGPTSPQNAAALRAHIAWLRPKLLGLRTSVGMGDRLGLATPGHARAVRAVGGDIAPIFAQQSIREMSRTGRTPQQVMDDATWGIFQEGWREGVGADADHLKTPADIDACVAAGFTFFTIDPGEHVESRANRMSPSELQKALATLPWEQLADDAESLRGRFVKHSFHMEGHRVGFDEHTMARAAVKYGRAIAHVAGMYGHLMKATGGKPFELEVSVDETETPTTHAEHIYIVRELRRLDVRWVSLAPRYVGQFLKGVDYVGNLKVFEDDFATHAAIARHFGPYKLSLHSGSDKFSVYPAAMRQTRGLVHLKTAGTSYLEALRTIASLDPDFFRAIYVFARQRYETDRASYHVSGSLESAPLPESVAETDLPALLDQFDSRQILHVTFGSVLTELASDGQPRFCDRFMSFLRSHLEAYAANLQKHFIRHLTPFAQAKQT
ncbi:MAG TPA: tagaturonate epimerase family protein [Terriglobia bacterium]|nr:tagaturonate epimerase family protein [Terriglobia bacterium]